MNFALRNAGTGDSGEVVATLLPSEAIVPLSGAQSYGALTVGGPSAVRPFTFLVNGLCGSRVEARLRVEDSIKPPVEVTNTFLLGETTYFTNAFGNSASISIPDRNAAFPYPSPILVSGLPDRIAKIIVTITNLIHTSPEDLDILLVGPGGQTALLMSDAGSSNDVANLTLQFDDEAVDLLPESGPLVSGTYRPTNFGVDDSFSPPAPAAPFGSTLSVFNDQTPNGTWGLYVFDDTSQNSGRIAVGWRLTLITRLDPECCARETPPSLAIMHTSAVEGNSGSALARFDVALSEPAAQVVTVNFATADGTALAEQDYAATNGMLQLAPGQTNATVTVAVRGDTLFEGDERFSVMLSNPINAVLAVTSAIGTIVDDEVHVLPLSVTGTGVSIQFNTVAGRNYRAEWADQLSATNAWVAVTGAALIAAPAALCR
jgi:subtilisin-like proprotein convertase family protein